MKVPNAPFRERYLELRGQGITASEIARRLDWWCRRHDATYPDITRIKRALGLMPYTGNYRRQAPQSTVTYEMALCLADALGLDPVEVGL